MKLKTLALITLVNLFVFTSCTDDNDTTAVAPKGDYQNGLLISNEGNFGTGVGTVTYVSGDLDTVENKVYQNVNGTTLGNALQSIAFNGDLAYLIENGSNTIEIVNRYTFISEGSIDTGFSNPRYMAFSNGKGYVTNWGDGNVATDDYIAVVDLLTNSVTSTISVAEGPEQIVSKNNKLYVALEGAFNSNNKVLIIDALNTASVTEIEVNDNPEQLQFDANGDLIVLSKGDNRFWLPNAIETKGAITKINTSSYAIESVLEFADGSHPNFLVLDNNIIFYYLDGSVYKMNATETTLPTTAIVSDVSFYGMTVKNGNILGVDAKDFSSNGDLLIYNATSGALLETLEMEIIPSKVYFN